MSAPRIDSVHREISDTIALLHYLDRNLDDLHDLAYNRHRAANEAKVRGGSRDYALDTHGDKLARDLYAKSADDLRDLLPKLRGLALDVRRHLTAGAGTVRRDPSADATVDEVIEAIEAQQRRRLRGEYEPTAEVTQPAVMSQTEWRKECEALRGAVRKAVSAFVDDHQRCRIEGTKPKRRIPTKLLTPREREAWQRAQSVSADQGEKAS